MLLWPTMDLALQSEFPWIEKKAKKRSALLEMIAVFREHGACATPAMVAAALGVSRQRVHQLTGAGRLPVVQVGEHPMIPLEALELFLTQERSSGTRYDFRPPDTFRKVLSDWSKKE